jgi:hypothetical protein
LGPPPYSPDLTPIEEMFSRVEGVLRTAAARTTEAVYEARGSALRAVSAPVIVGSAPVAGARTGPVRD